MAHEEQAALYYARKRRRRETNRFPARAALDLQDSNWAVAFGATVTGEQTFTLAASAGSAVEFAFTEANLTIKEPGVVKEFEGFIRLNSMAVGAEPFNVDVVYSDGGPTANVVQSFALTVAANFQPFKVKLKIEDFATGKLSFITADAVKSANLEINRLSLKAVFPP